MVISDRTAAFAGALAGMWLATTAVGLWMAPPDEDTLDPPATPPRVAAGTRAGTWSIVELNDDDVAVDADTAGTRNADTDGTAGTRNADRVAQALTACEWP